MYSMDYSNCALKCLVNMSCFSFNFATLPDNNSGQHLCELLASDKYNHANSFVPSRNFHHFAIPVGFSTDRFSKIWFYFDSMLLTGRLRTFAPIATAHPYSARKFTCHVMHRARALSTKMNNDRADGHCYSFAWI